MKNGVFWVVTPCGSCKNRRFGGTSRLLHQGDKYRWEMVFLRSVRRLLVAACVVPSSPSFVTLMKEASGSSETSVLTRATRRNNPEDTILRVVFLLNVWPVHMQGRFSSPVLVWCAHLVCVILLRPDSCLCTGIRSFLYGDVPLFYFRTNPPQFIHHLTQCYVTSVLDAVTNKYKNGQKLT
jgi:hypothetical protein